jgi:glycosyltransferase involved in cell wall biosynthesis
MARADLHVHSRYSEHPSEWFLKRLGAKESYTDPEHIYRLAKARGMDYVTITDHNRIEGSLLLRESHPDDTFTGVECTSYFPEDNCKVHILVYGLDQGEFDEIQHLRTDVYQLRDYLRGRSLTHSVAHATYPVNGLLTVEHLEKLILLFDVFEGINGGRNRANNRTWTDVLSRLDEASIERLRRKHGIEPGSPKPWLKGLTAGSDDHAGLFIAQTSTAADASTPEEFLRSVAAGRTLPMGRSNDYQSLVFTVYKIAHDFSRERKNGASTDLIASLTDLIFEKRDFRLKEKLFLKFLASTSGGSRVSVYKLLNSLIEDVRKNRESPIGDRLELVYSRISDLADEFMRALVGSVKKDVADGDVVGFVTNASASIPGIFLFIPFFTAIRDMLANKPLLDRLRQEFILEGTPPEARRILWFTDTFSDLNGVSVTLDKVSQMARTANPGVRIVTCLTPEEEARTHSDGILSLPYIDTFSLPGYERYLMKVPSVLRVLDLVSRYEPDGIYISTPGPIGLTGLLVARLMSLPVTGFFHTDYSRQATRIVSDESVNDLIESYVKWFFRCCDEVRVPTKVYMDILTDRGYDLRNMVLFRRGIDTGEFSPGDGSEEEEAKAASLREGRGPVLVYTGRISRDKNLDLAIRAFGTLLDTRPEATFLIIGDGPHLDEIRERFGGTPGLRFLGRLPHSELPALYADADLFVFPSDADTFGMSVLEAQSCGLPAIVSSQGGPMEIIEDGITGLVALAGDLDDWSAKIAQVVHLMESDRDSYLRMRRESRNRVLSRYDWRTVYQGLFPPFPGKTP